MSEPFDPALLTSGIKAEGLDAGYLFFGHWKLEFGYCLLFDNWCLEFSPLTTQLNTGIHRLFYYDRMK